MISDIFSFLYFSVLIISVFAGIKNKKSLNRSGNLILILIAFLLTSELIAEILGRNMENNMVVYHISCPVELLILCSYFRSIIISPKAKRTATWVGYLAVIVSVANTVFLQPINTLNSNFLLFEACIIIGFSIFTFYEMIVREDSGKYYNVHFWFTSILIFLWSGVFFYWGIYIVLIEEMREHFFYLTYLFWGVNLLAYSGFAMVFLRFKTLIGDIQ